MSYRSHLSLPANGPIPGNRLLRLRQACSLLTTQRLYQVALSAILVVGFSLPLRLLDRFSLREDEALYSFWALHGWREDPFFFTVWPDKPPLFLWLLALAFQVGGASQATGRLLNIMVSLLTALLIGATARHWWGRRSGVLATLLYLLNPFVISFAPTVYTDPLLVLAGQLALFLAATGRSVGAGFWLAVAIMTKQQGVLYVPLIVGVLGCCHSQRSRGRTWLWFGLGAGVVLAPLLYWDSLRWAVAPSPWDLSVRNYGALHLLPPAAWWARSREWATVLWYFTANGSVWLWLGGMGIGALLGLGMRPTISAQSARVLWWLLFWSFAFLALHIVTSVQIWDRYLLPLAPMLALLSAWAIATLDGYLRHTRVHWWWVAGSLAGLLWLVPPALSASTGGLPIGSDHGAYSGLPEAIHWLETQTTGKTILYHQRLGWHYQFYLYDQLAAGVYELRWFPTPTYLADNAAKNSSQARFLLQPDWAPQPDLPRHLAVRRSELIPRAHFGQMTVYEIRTKPHLPCTWCLCRPSVAWTTLSSPDRLLEPR